MQSKRGFLFGPSSSSRSLSRLVSNGQVSSALWVRLAAAVPLALVVAAILAACGGTPVASESAASSGAGQARVIQPLFDDDGNPAATDPAALPADPALLQNGHYATAAQARLLLDSTGARAVEIAVDCCGNEPDQIGLVSMWIDEVSSGLPASTPVLVRGSDLRLAALAANRIASGGLANVWLVTQ